ncbi:hypothetical protein B0H13DRAFT_2541246 [Mycena leptocephala]|nr:hypothetical protein B0H13DRAFT_2541246 [Mycena leptocephala]
MWVSPRLGFPRCPMLRPSVQANFRLIPDLRLLQRIAGTSSTNFLIPVVFLRDATRILFSHYLALHNHHGNPFARRMLPSQLFSTMDTRQMFISFTRPKCFPHAVMAPAKGGTEPNPATEFVGQDTLSQRFFRGGPPVSVPSDNVPLSPSSFAMGRTTIYSRHAAIALDNLTTWWSPPPHKPYRDMFAFPFPGSLQRSADVPCPRQSAPGTVALIRGFLCDARHCGHPIGFWTSTAARQTNKHQKTPSLFGLEGSVSPSIPSLFSYGNCAFKVTLSLHPSSSLQQAGDNQYAWKDAGAQLELVPAASANVAVGVRRTCKACSPQTAHVPPE